MADQFLDMFDRALCDFSTTLRDDLKIDVPESNALATTIKNEILAIEPAKLPTLTAVTADSPLSLKDRYHELTAFMSWWLNNQNHDDGFGQVVALNYMAFVFLSESCFKVLRSDMPAGSVAKKCCIYLTDNPVRAFRNALSHGNWRGTMDRSGIDYWAKKGSDPNEPMTRFRASVHELNFWHQLSMGRHTQSYRRYKISRAIAF